MARRTIALAAAAVPTAAIFCDSGKPQKHILVVGSLNADIIIEISRMPQIGETLAARNPDTGFMVPGGKGANQAVACARLAAVPVEFACQFGNDPYGTKLEGVLKENNVGISACGHVDKPSGQAFIFLDEHGDNSIILSAAANGSWPDSIPRSLSTKIQGSSVVLLQREIPEYVNEAVAVAAAKAGALVIQDVGGEERPMSDSLLSALSFIFPNETELARLTGMPTDSDDQIITAARTLQQKGVRCVCVTLGSKGSLLIDHDGSVLREGCFKIPGSGKVVDTTGAGDTYRAAFAVALVEGKTLKECMQFAAAAGAVTVSRAGAIPSLPARSEVEQVLAGGN